MHGELRTKLWVDIYPADTNGTPDGEDQVTTYTYGVVKGTDPGESLFANGRLLKTVAYPDTSGGTDAVSFAYNAQGQQVWMKDQAGNIIQSDYDTGGRVTHKRATTIVAGFDGYDDADSPKRISYTYDGLGRTSTVTQYDEAIVGDEDEDVTDEVKYTYNGWGLVSLFEQDVNSAVGAEGSVDDYEVSYTYAKATEGRNTVRLSTMVLPPGNKTITYGVRGSSGSDHDDEASRVAKVSVGVTTVVEYQYNGVGQLVALDYPQPAVKSNQFGATGLYPDLDRFNRVATSRWTKGTNLGDKDFYVVGMGYDRNSNITFANEVGVHAGFDVKYTIDDMNRLTKAEEGTYSAGSISSRTRQQIWTLDQVGNWSIARLDLNGDNDFIDSAPTLEHDDSRTHNLANELIDRDFDDDGDTSYDDTHRDLTYDAVGNLTDDDELYRYEYDVFGRLRRIWGFGGFDKLLAEYRYNGLGYRIAWHEDTDASQEVDGSDLWYYAAYDTSWRNVATFRGTDANPKEQFVYHASASSKLDDLILRERDMTNGWTGAADGTLEQRHYFCQNWRGDVVAVVSSSGTQVEQVRYSSYGIAFGMAAGDVDSDGDVDAADATQIQAWIDAPSYDVRGDLDLDGDVDATDKTICQANAGNNLGWGKLSLTAVGNRKGYAGYERDMNLPELCHVRHRVLNTTLGRWTRRDPLPYGDGVSLYQYASSRPLTYTDQMGLQSLMVQVNPQGPTTACGPCPPANLLQDPQVQQAMNEAQQACGCTPKFKCVGWVPSGTAATLPGLFGACPTIYLPCPPTGIDAGTLAHELRHAWQFCTYSITSPLTGCEELICREVDAYRYDGTCSLSGWHADGTCYGSYDCCNAACGSVDLWAFGVCDLIDDCKKKCNKFLNKGWCHDGHFTGPIWWWL